MSQHVAWSVETQFEDRGSLRPPGPAGRLVRFVLGAFLLYSAYSLLVSGPSGLVRLSAPTHFSFWLTVLFAAHVTPYVVNIGFGVSWKRRPQYALLTSVVILIVVDLAVFGSWWAPPLGGFVLVWLLYVLGHLGVSFVLSSLIATPGCEMRAFPHLWTLVTGRSTMEHYCPGPISRIDRWERGRAQG